MDDEPQDLWALLDLHAIALARTQNVRLPQERFREARQLLTARGLEEQALRERLIDFAPSSNDDAQAKLIYMTLVVAATRGTLDDDTWSRIMASIDHFLRSDPD